MPIIAPGIFYDEESKLWFFNCQHVLDVLEKLGVELVTRHKVMRELIEQGFQAETRWGAAELRAPTLRLRRNEHGDWRIE